MHYLRKAVMFLVCFCFALSAVTFSTADTVSAKSAKKVEPFQSAYFYAPYYSADENNKYEVSREKVPDSVSLKDGTEYWYKVWKLKDPSEWVAFTYDPHSKYFVMYADFDGKIQAYSERKFYHIIGGYIVGLDVDSLIEGAGASSGYYKYNSGDNCFYNENTHEGIHEYITTAMKIVRHHVKR